MKLADVGSRVRVVVTAVNRAGEARALSDATEVVLPKVAVPKAPGKLPRVEMP